MEARFAQNPFLQVSHVPCAIQPAFPLWHILWLLPVQGFILEYTKACYHFQIVALCGLQIENPSYHQKMRSAD